jgi:hypothetical protein
MGYGMYFPAHQVGGQLELWGIRSYGVSGVWVKRSSTVYAPSTRALFCICKLVGISATFVDATLQKSGSWAL